MVIADVGQDMLEEIDYVPSPAPGRVGGAGANYGWNCREGLIAYSGAPESCEGAGGFTDPVFDYPHTDPLNGGAYGCAIMGGYVVRDPNLGALYGRYLYGDYCTGQLRSIDPSAPEPQKTDRAETGLSVPANTLYSFGEDSCGRIYVVDGGGPVYRLLGEEAASCSEPEPEPEPEPKKPGPSPQSQPQQAIEIPAGVGARLRVRARPRRVPRGRRVQIVARVEPCGPSRGRWVLLNRGGRRLAAKRLGRDCVVRFRTRVLHRSSFRVLLPLPGGAGTARSPRLVVHTRGP